MTILFSFIGIFSSIVCVLLNKLDIYSWLWLMPLIYSAVIVIFSKSKVNHRYNSGLVFKLANFACLMKYAVTPIGMVFAEYSSVWGRPEGMWGPTPKKEIITEAIIIETIECILVYITFYFAIQKKNRKKKINTEGNNCLVLFKNRIVVGAFCIIAFLYILLVSPNSLKFSGVVNVSQNASSEVSETIEHAGVVVVFKQILLISILLLLWDFIYKKINVKHGKIFLSLIVFAGYLSLTSSYSRWNLLFALVSGFYVLGLYYGKEIRKYIFIFAIIFVMAFIGISTVKFSYSIGETPSINTLFSTIFAQMQDYGSGPRLVAQAIDMRRKYRNYFGLSTVINDLFGNVPLISVFFNQQNRMNSYFCNYNFGNWTNRSLLLPMVGEGYCYIPFFPWYLSIVFAILIIIFDNRAKTEKYLEFKYLYMLEGCWLSFSLCLNFQTNWGHLIQVFAMTWLVYALNKKVTLKRKSSVKGRK